MLLLLGRRLLLTGLILGRICSRTSACSALDDPCASATHCAFLGSCARTADTLRLASVVIMMLTSQLNGCRLHVCCVPLEVVLIGLLLSCIVVLSCGGAPVEARWEELSDILGRRGAG